MLMTEMYVALLPMPVIILPTSKAFIVGAAAVTVEPIANNALPISKMFLLPKMRSFPLRKVNVRLSTSGETGQATIVDTNHLGLRSM